MGVSGAMHICPLCSKPINTDSAFTRHVAYCRRSQAKEKKRKRSCLQCNSAKVKCSFEAVCARCQSKGLPCAYNGTPSPATSPEGASPDGEMKALTVKQSSNITSFGSAMNIITTPTAPRLAMTIRTDPLLRHSADVTLEAFRALPRMMARRETYGWYVHGQWNEIEFPYTLVRCAEISQLYMTGKPGEQGPFLAAVSQENKRLLQQLPLATKKELLVSKQALLAYLVMAAADTISNHGIPELPLNSLMTSELVYNKIVELDQMKPLDVGTMGDPDQSWDDWIYDESRRRAAILYFLLSRVIDVRFGARCPSIVGYRGLPLPSPSEMWQARTHDEWFYARQEWLQTRKTSMQTYGDLIDARETPNDPTLRRQLDEWHATCDKLGLLLALATVMV